MEVDVIGLSPPNNKFYTITINTMEERKDVVWYEWLYKVSNLWKVINKKWRLKKCYFDKDWYLRLKLSKLWKQHWYWLHKVVLMSFIPNIDNKRTVNHEDWDKLNNGLDNLTWMTDSENGKHAYDVLKRVSPQQWRFYDKHNTARKIIQLDRTWNFIKEWSCIRIAWETLWIHRWSISWCCKWILKTAGGYRREHL